jgi:hypothetical protein
MYIQRANNFKEKNLYRERIIIERKMYIRIYIYIYIERERERIITTREIYT